VRAPRWRRARAFFPALGGLLFDARGGG
jgi:hypothetical protein